MTAQALNCSQCGAALQVRGMKHTRSLVCPQCLSVLDASSPALELIHKFEARLRVEPLIPLGWRGKWHGAIWEIIGFQVRTITVEGRDYSWHEYLLFNPFRGFRYLTQYNGHWNDVLPTHGRPETFTQQGRPAARYAGVTFRHFQRAVARTTFVLGEFPWRVEKGERAVCDDYVAPPQILSRELSGDEENWSIGSYVDGASIWSHFQLPGAPPARSGVFANQPSPYQGRIRKAWRRFFILSGLWLALLIYFYASAQNREVFRQTFRFVPGQAGEQSFVTPIFELTGGPSNVGIDISTDLDNNWVYLNLALINEDTGQGLDFGRELSYYSGRDSDGSWSEGSRRDSVVLPRVAAGRYYLRVEPESDPQDGSRAVDYQIVVRRDVPAAPWIWLALPLLLLPPLVVSLRAAAFEGARWSESDYSPSGGTD